MSNFSVGDTVRLNVPENDRLHDAVATIVELTNWGAHVYCLSAETRSFRALFSEMMTVLHTNGKMTASIESGYTGDICNNCGGSRMRRNGSCLLCDDCGTTSGCS